MGGVPQSTLHAQASPGLSWRAAPHALTQGPHPCRGQAGNVPFLHYLNPSWLAYNAVWASEVEPSDTSLSTTPSDGLLSALLDARPSPTHLLHQPSVCSPCCGISCGLFHSLLPPPHLPCVPLFCSLNFTRVKSGCFSFPDGLLRLPSYPSSSTPSRMARFHSFWWPSSLPLCISYHVRLTRPCAPEPLPRRRGAAPGRQTPPPPPPGLPSWPWRSLGRVSSKPGANSWGCSPAQLGARTGSPGHLGSPRPGAVPHPLRRTDDPVRPFCALTPGLSRFLPSALAP